MRNVFGKCCTIVAALLCSILLLYPGELAGQPSIISIAPATNAGAAARNADIDIQFSETMSAASIDEQSVLIFGEQSGFLSTSGNFSVNAATASFDPSNKFYAGERIFVTVTNAQNSGGTAMDRPWSWLFSAAAEPAQGAGFGRSDYDAVSQNSQWAAVGDLDNDGRLDICLNHQDVNQFAVMLGDGAGGFALDAAYGVGQLPGALVLGDFDADGDLDVAASNVIDNDISVLFNDGSAGFSGRTDYAVGSVPQKIEAADLNGDGAIDLITANLHSDNVSVLLNNGNGTFAAATAFAAGDGCLALRAADVNNDGFMDLLTANSNDQSLGVLLNNGAGSFAAAVTSATGGVPQELYSGDLDGDGDADVALTLLDDNELAVRFNDGSGSFGPVVSYGVGVRPKSVVFTDLDGDGDLDAAVSNRNIPFTISVLRNNGAGVFAPDITFPALGPECVVSGDFDGDGDVDLATANETVLGNQLSVFLNPDVPARLAFGAITPDAPNSGQSFAVNIQAQRNNGSISNVTTATAILASFSHPSLSLGGGSLSGTITNSAAALNFAIDNSSLSAVTTTISVSVQSGMILTSTSTSVTIGANQAPTISTSQTAVSTTEDTARLIAVALGDAETAVGALTLSATSSNQSLLPDGNISQQGATAATTVFNLLPNANASGVALVTISAADGLQTSSVVFTLSVSAVNDAPTIATNATMQSFDEDGSTTITVVIADIDNATAALVVSATSGNPALIPDGNITQIGATAATVKLQIASATNANGVAPITVSVNDGGISRSTVFTITVNAVNDAPVVSLTIASIATDEDNTTTAIINLVDVDTPFNQLLLSATSANPALIPDANILQLSPTASTITVRFEPVSNANGVAPITISASDGEFIRSTIITVTVNPVNDAPTINTIADRMLAFNGATTLNFLIDDIDNVVTGLTVTATSNNQSLIADAKLALGATAASMNLSFGPECDQSGSALITLSVSDGSLSSSASFTAQVQTAATIFSISGATRACPDVLLEYSVLPEAAALKQEWNPIGGTVIGGQGSTNVQVLWTSGAASELRLTRTFVNGCTSATSISVLAQTALAQMDFAAVNGSTSVTLAVLDNDSAGLTIISVDDPTHGTASLHNGIVTYTADAGFSGLDRFAYTVENAAGCRVEGIVGVAVAETKQHAVNIEFVEREQDRIDGVRGLRQAAATVLSPDGRFLYVAGRGDNSIAIFSRSSSGSLTYLGRARNGSGGVSGLKYPYALAISPDGGDLYAAGYGNNAVVHFALDRHSGSLSFVERINQGQNSGGQMVDGLSRPRGLATSPDGKSVYVAAYASNALAVFRRAPNGRLLYLEGHKDGVGGVDGLRRAIDVAISPDARHIYVAGYSDHAVAVFSRSLSDGRLSFVERHRDGVNGVDGLKGATSLALSPDGLHVYATGRLDHAVALFSRNLSTGALSFVKRYKDGVGVVNGLAGASAVSISPDGRHVWAAGSADDAVALFERDPLTGELTWLEMAQDGAGGVDGLDHVLALTIGAYSEHLYSAGFRDNAAAALFRNRAPQAINDEPGNVAPNNLLVISPLLNDSDPDAHNLSITSVTGASLGATSITGGGTTINYNAAAAPGADTFSYTIADGHGGVSTATVSVGVTPAKSGVSASLNPQRLLNPQSERTGWLSAVEVSPNPATDKVTVTFRLQEAAPLRLRLVNMAGVSMIELSREQLQPGDHSIVLDTRHPDSLLPAGVYIVEITLLRAGEQSVSAFEALLIRR